MLNKKSYIFLINQVKQNLFMKIKKNKKKWINRLIGNNKKSNKTQLKNFFIACQRVIPV